VLKGRSSGQAAYVNNEHKGGSGNMGNYTVYVNPYIVLKSGGYTKHYYIEGQRIVSKLGGDLSDATKGQKAGGGKINYPDKQEGSREGIVRNLKWLGQDGALLTAGNSGKTPRGRLGRARLSAREKEAEMEAAMALFNFINQLYENTSFIITTNKMPADWAKMLDDEVLATALLDRLLFRCEIINLTGKSYRMKNRKTFFDQEK
jgi:hypothetical protein